jgi:hypothetical protein
LPVHVDSVQAWEVMPEAAQEATARDAGGLPFDADLSF